MQVNETLNEGLKRAYSIKLTAVELDTKVNEKLLEARPDVEMKGFRKGKVPMALLKRQFGQRIMGEAMQETIDGAMSKHFKDSGDRPAMQPNIEMQNGEMWKEGDDVEVFLTYEALPTIPEVDFSKIKLQKLVVKSDKAAVDEALDNLAASANDFKDRKKGAKAKDGDQVVIDFVGTVGGEAFDGGSSEDYPLVLGSNSFIPGFETQLLGCKAGEDHKVNVTFPEEYGSKDLAGKDAEFSCKVKNVKEPVPAKINDELATKFGAEDLKALKTQISERLESEYGGAARAVMKRKLLDALDKKVKFELPPSLVEAEAKQIAHQLYHEENPDDQGHDHDNIEPNKEHTKLAERRVRLGLLLAELGQKAEVEVSDAEMSQAIMAQSRQYPGQEKEFFEFMQKNEQMQQQLRAPIFEDKVVDHIFEQATVADKKVDKVELQTAVEALEKD
ncbi:trigger factor [Paracoccaceae bacterium]|nr:trigger factor [Paracoccaceae bacterium]